jgi:serine phosphatase RsbU (regulator of sigma subunit)
MVVRSEPGEQGAAEAIRALADAGSALGAASTRGAAMEALASAAARATGAEVAVVRVVDDGAAQLSACAVASASAAVAAELEGSRFAVAELPAEEEGDLARMPDAVRRAAERVRATAVFQIPVQADGRPVGSLELMRAGVPFDDAERRIARLAAGQAALAIRAFQGDGEGPPGAADPARGLALAGEALAAGVDEDATAEQVTRLAAEAMGALAGLLWRVEEGRRPRLVASHGLAPTKTALVEAGDAAERALRARGPVTVESGDVRLPEGAGVSASLPLGQPAVGALQLLFPTGHAPSAEELARLARFGVRAAHALRAAIRARAVELELERTRTLLAVVAQAISQLSLAHTLETVLVRVQELLEVERLAIYLRDEGRLYAAAGVGLAGPHVRLAERLLDLALGPFRGRGIVVVHDATLDSRLGPARDAAAEAGIEAAVGVPLLVHDERVGLLCVFPPRGRTLAENENALLGALAAQLAVAVQNAQLHERAKQLGEERERALDAERAASRQLRALYEISRSFAQSLSLESTLDAVAATIVDVLDVDVAVLGMPDGRRDFLVPRAMKVAEARLDEVAHTLLFQPVPFGTGPLQRLFRLGESFRLTPRTVARLGDHSAALRPFLERGWTGAVVPIATTAEVLASLTILSLRPGSPVTGETIEQARAIAGQAALAIDNARLYQQQKEFADTMQRSLLPRGRPALPGLEIGDAYESSARMEVGGDVYDFVELPDGRLAVVLGDVTGHGIEAAADMAMAKFVFRSLAREHPDPGEFLRAANDVVVGEIAPGKFITMVYLVIHAAAGEVAGAGAGHPPPRLIRADGRIESFEVRGLVLGIEAGQDYEEVRRPIEPGDAVVLYTDGVLEARREGELYGFERLDALLARHRELPPEELARKVLDDCRAFAEGELADDCAVVVVKRTAVERTSG